MPAKKSKVKVKVKSTQANIEEVDNPNPGNDVNPNANSGNDVNPNANSDSNVDPKEEMKSIIAKKENLIKILKTYANPSGSVTRMMIVGLPDKVNLYHELIGLEKDLERIHTEWKSSLDGSVIQSLEDQSDPLSPTKFSSMFDESGEAINGIVSFFKRISFYKN